MKCSKCGFDNDENAIFCEKCDWKLGETYIPEMKINRSVFSVITVILGVVAVVPILLDTALIASVIIGALGLVLGGYSFNIPRLTQVENRAMLMLLSGIGLILSVFAFIYGMYLML